MNTQYKLLKWYPSLPNWFKVGTVVIKDRNSNAFIYYITSSGYEIKVNEVENNPEFWEEVKEKVYRNLIFKSTEDGYEWQQCGDTKLVNRCGDEILYDSTIHYLYSVERLKDNHRFTIGDVIEFYHHSSKITSIDIDDEWYGGIVFSGEEKNDRTCIQTATPSEPLFKTEDGYDVYKREDVWVPYIDHSVKENYSPSITPVEVVYECPPSDLPIFKERENVDRWIGENAPKYSDRDIQRSLSKLKVFNRVLIEDFLEELDNK